MLHPHSKSHIPLCLHMLSGEIGVLRMRVQACRTDNKDHNDPHVASL